MRKDFQIEIIVDLCKVFREAIEHCDKRLLPISFRNFPNGSCGDTVPLLGAFLKEKKAGIFYYVLGHCRDKFQDYKSHAWLENDDGLIIDITADQFEKIDTKIIVTYTSLWHKKNKGEVLHIAHYNIYDKPSRLVLENAYKEICKVIRNY